MSIFPTKIKKDGDAALVILWNDGSESRYPIILLRDSCPCASCAGEQVLFQAYVPPPPDTSVQGRYELKGIQQVGSYAIQLEWGDNHMTGIYSWEYLLKLCPRS